MIKQTPATLVFSEIKWSYVLTRKQQILSRLPKTWHILFVEPYKKGRDNSFVPYFVQPNVQVVTFPFLKHIRSSSRFRRALIWLLASPITRLVYYRFSWVWLSYLLRISGFRHPALVIYSNLYAVPYLQHFRCAKVYDMNDNHVAFEWVPRWAFVLMQMAMEAATRIVTASRMMRLLVPNELRRKVAYIGNGVSIHFLARQQYLLYAGSIGETLDFSLLASLCAKLPPDTKLYLAGPVAAGYTTRLDELRGTGAVYLGELSHTVLHEIIKGARACLMPFRTTALTVGLNPNKLYEYLALGKPVIAVGLVSDLARFVYAAKDKEEFFALANRRILPPRAGSRAFVRRNTWELKARQYQCLIEKLWRSS